MLNKGINQKVISHLWVMSQESDKAGGELRCVDDVVCPNEMLWKNYPLWAKACDKL